MRAGDGGKRCLRICCDAQALSVFRSKVVERPRLSIGDDAQGSRLRRLFSALLLLALILDWLRSDGYLCSGAFRKKADDDVWLLNDEGPYECAVRIVHVLRQVISCMKISNESLETGRAASCME